MTFKQTFTEEELGVITGALLTGIGAVLHLEQDSGAVNVLDLFTLEQRLSMESLAHTLVENNTDINQLLKQAWDILHQKEGKEDEQEANIS
jgi:hypothetical protein